MTFQLKTEPGSPPGFTSSTRGNYYQEMSISDLVSELRAAYKVEHFDQVEEELVKRDAILKAELGSLKEKILEERRVRTEAEEKLKIREEEFEKGKRTKENYEKLLKEVKQNGLLHKNTVEELRQKNLVLERENRELKELKKKWVEANDTVAELRIRVGELEKEKKAGDKSALDALRMKNNELEEAVKKNLKIQEELRTENCRLTDEKGRREALIESLERKFGELSVRVVKLEDDTKLLMSEDASGGGSTEVKPQANRGATYATGWHVPLQKNGDIHNSLGVATAQSRSKGNEDALDASAGGRVKLENVEIIDLDDDDDVGLGCTSQGLHGKKAISQIIAENEHPGSSNAVQHKRKCMSDVEISTSTSSSSSDNPLLSSRAIACEKRSKTSTYTGHIKHPY